MADPTGNGTAERIIEILGMVPHPEGGHFVEIYRDGGPPAADQAADRGPRGAVSAIYFLLKAGERSHWHRVTDAAEIWAWHGGDPLELAIAADVGIRRVRLGMDLAAGQRPQAVVPAGAWQAARSAGAWSLVGCVVAPAFTFDSFELAPPDWSPTDG